MAEFSRLVITNKGQALLAKMMTGEGNVEFTKISTSDMEYTLEQLEALTEFSGVKQTVSVAKVTRTNGVAVTIEAIFDNLELTQGYHMRALGLYAIDPDDGEILYAVTAEVSGCCYMPAYNGVTVSGACIKLVTTVGNAENVSLEVDPGVYATVGEIKELRESVDGIETWKDSTQKRLNNWGPTIVGHGQIINNNRDRITALDTRVNLVEQSIENTMQIINPKTPILNIKSVRLMWQLRKTDNSVLIMNSIDTINTYGIFSTINRPQSRIAILNMGGTLFTAEPNKRYYLELAIWTDDYYVIPISVHIAENSEHRSIYAMKMTEVGDTMINMGVTTGNSGAGSIDATLITLILMEK